MENFSNGKYSEDWDEFIGKGLSRCVTWCLVTSASLSTAMSEYWVSHKRYHCKYCNIYIADDVPSRQHHENGMRHKGNVERFVRGLYKAGEKAVKDRDEEKREMERISKVR
jgi:hypothetical protein